MVTLMGWGAPLSLCALGPAAWKSGPADERVTVHLRNSHIHSHLSCDIFLQINARRRETKTGTVGMELVVMMMMKMTKQMRRHLKRKDLMRTQ